MGLGRANPKRRGGALQNLAILYLAFGLAFELAAQDATPANLHVPAGFAIEKVAGKTEVRFPMFAAFDDRGRLFVAESSGLDLYAELSAQTRQCRVRLLEDRDGDGRFETSRPFADRLVFPMGLAWRDGKLFVADPPDLVSFEDTDGDGRADRRTVILSGFGHRDNGSLHGLTFGPDGWLYMTLGHPDGYRFNLPDGSVLKGEGGALIRCRADGSNVEVLCRGFENLVEVVFTARGEIIGTDNWFQRPSGGLRDALVHLVEGGLYPLHQEGAAAAPAPVGDLLPAISMFPAVALSGLVLYRGAAFPAEMRGNLFSAQHNARKIGRHLLVEASSTFRTQDEDFLTSDDPDFHPSDVLEDADGSLLVLDTGSWYTQHCPTGKIRKSPAPGGIYRVRYPKARRLEDPWGLKENFSKVSNQRLASWLSDPRPVVRDRAERVLSSRGREVLGTLYSLLGNSSDRTAKQHALRALGTMADSSAVGRIFPSVFDRDAEVAATAVRSLGNFQTREFSLALGRLLFTAPPPVRMAAAEALAHGGDSHALPVLWQALAGQPDRFLEHALIYAAHRIATGPDLVSALANSNPHVQRAALLLLAQPPRDPAELKPEMVLPRITAANAELRQTALGLLQKHPTWASHALTLVQHWLEKPALTAEEELGLRGLILAFQSEPALQQLVGSAMDKARPALCLLLLDTLAQSSQARFPQAWIGALGQSLQRTNAAICLHAARAVAVLQISALDQTLAELAESAGEPTEIRLEALRSLVSRRPKLTAVSHQFLLAELGSPSNPLARLTAGEVLKRSHLTDLQTLSVLKALQGQTLIPAGSLLAAFRETTGVESTSTLLDYLGGLLHQGTIPAAEFQRFVERLPAEARDQAEPLRKLVRPDAEAQRAKLAKYEPLLKGGQAEKGRAIFFGQKLACATCHAIGNDGGRIGPDLTKIGAIRSGPDILESIVLPSSTFAQGYEPYLIVAKDDREAMGVIARQNAETVVLRDSSGAETQFHRQEIRELRRQTTSIMPEGLETGLTGEEFRDLLAFLQHLK